MTEKSLKSNLEWKKMEFIPHDTWLAMSIDYTPIESIKFQLEQIQGKPLKNRGEAHITVITPPEFDTLRDNLSMAEINKIAIDYDIQNVSWKPICVGSGKNIKDSSQLVYFVVVESNELFAIRHKILNAYFAKLNGQKTKSKTLFNPDHFYPHITIAFTEKDIHEQDGLIKNTSTCLFDLSSMDGKPLTNWNLINH